MKARMPAALFIMALGIVIAATPEFFFPVCEAQIKTFTGMFVPMKCFWTGKALQGCGASVSFAGLLLLFINSGPMRLGVQLMLFPLGLLIIALPNGLIGVCLKESMPCHMGTLPAATILGVLTALLPLVALVRYRLGRRAHGDS